METQINNSNPEIADILNNYADQFILTTNLSFQQIRTIKDISKCRTSECGAHKLVCNHCNHEHISYNSCRNRHCPKCQLTKQVKWIDKLKSNMLPVKYFHIVFTLPSQLRSLAYINQKIVYAIIFKAAAATLKQVAANPKFLGAETAFLAVLHTWGQNLSYHPHLHIIVSGGGLDQDGVEWKYSGKKFFVPVKALSRVFRAKFIDMLYQEYSKESLKFPGYNNDINYYDFARLKTTLREKDWNVYTKKAFKGAGNVIEYLGRYSHRVAISNSRIISISNGKVKFRYKDYKDNNKWKILEISVIEFIRRFVQYILPDNFYKIRYYGLMANNSRNIKLEAGFAWLNENSPISKFDGLVWHEIIESISGKDIFKCPVCKKGRLVNPAITLHNTA
jgi:hypothetical protein